MSKLDEFIDALRAVHRESIEVAERKNRDYGDSWAEDGVVGVVIRMGDKLKRLKTITDEGHTIQVGDEGLRDTLLDLHNYAGMAVAYLDGYRPAGSNVDAAIDTLANACGAPKWSTENESFVKWHHALTHWRPIRGWE